MNLYPRIIDPALTFNRLVNWFHDEMLIKKQAPGFIIGLSGTDSLVTFCAAYKALEAAGKMDRMLGVHFAPSEDFLYDNPVAESHLWFSKYVIPWLKEFAPGAKIEINTSIDWRHDGLRWGCLMDMSVVSNDKKRAMLFPEDQYWLVGTRNKTEVCLSNFSNASSIVSIQPIVDLWKSEVLQLSAYLGLPQIAIDKSCQTDCICGRNNLAAKNIRTVDLLLMLRRREVSEEYIIKNSYSQNLLITLSKYIEAEISKNSFKSNIPYLPIESIVINNSLISTFEEGNLNLKIFDHQRHLEIAFYYLKEMNLDSAIERYAQHLKPLLDSAGQSHKFNLLLTKEYFIRLEQAMKLDSTNNFIDFIKSNPSVLDKISM
jgi:NH3-dependent NAD+ synthetase